jgi:hypothetical protein
MTAVLLESLELDDLLTAFVLKVPSSSQPAEIGSFPISY